MTYPRYNYAEDLSEDQFLRIKELEALIERMRGAIASARARVAQRIPDSPDRGSIIAWLDMAMYDRSSCHQSGKKEDGTYKGHRFDCGLLIEGGGMECTCHQVCNVPEGWKLELEGDTCLVQGPGETGFYVGHGNDRDNIASVMLYRFAKAVLHVACTKQEGGQ